MKWMRLSVGFPRDPKIKELSRSERLFYLELCMWATEQDTDGRIPTSVLSLIGDGHRGKRQTLQKMVVKGLLSHSTCVDEYHITAWDKWLMVQPASKPKIAGQGQDGDEASRAHVGARTNDTERSSIYLSDDSLAPVVEVKDPRLAALVDKIARKVNSNGTAQ